MSTDPTVPLVGAAAAGALLALLVTPLLGAVEGSAAHLEVDGGTLQTITVDAAPRPDVPAEPSHGR